MKQTKRILSVALCLLMLVAVVPVGVVSHATSQREAIINVAIGELGYHEKASDSSLDSKTDNSGSANYTKYGKWYGIKAGAWCAMFVCWCANQAGISTSIIPKFSKCIDPDSSASGSEKFKAMGRWKDNSYIPSPGDLIFVKESHVGIVEYVSGSTIHTIEGNYSDQVKRVTRSVGASTIAGFGVPKYNDESTNSNLGNDFYATILNTKYWKPISQNINNGLVTLENEKNAAYQRWRFIRLNDEEYRGAYRIESCANGQALQMTGGTRTSGTQISTADWWNGACQKWYLIPEGDGYKFLNAHYTSEGWYMDLKGNSNTPGTKIQIYTKNNSTAQIWSVYTSDDVQLKRPNLTVTPGNSTQKTIFTWKSVYGCMRYDVKIWRNKVDHSVDSYHTEWGATSGYSIQLPPGTYEAYVTANDYYQCLGSADVKFTVTGNTPANQPVNLGNDFYAVILTYDAWVPIANDYSNTHNVFLQKGEHQQNSAHQLWRFQRQSDGSYAISSAQDGRFLEMREGEHVENTPVAAMNPTFWDGAYQKWWIYENNGGGYFIKSEHFTSQGWYMTLKNNQTAIGTQVTACSLKGTPSQVWGIYINANTQLKAPTLTVTPGTAATNTTFSWPHVFGAKGFTIKVWKNAVNTSTNPDYTKTVTGTSGALNLPAGTYEALVVASNQYQSFNSNKVKFTVQQATYKINYNYNGGSCAPMTQTKIHGQDLVLTKVVPYRVGYVFQNWNTKLNGTGTVYKPGDTYKANEAATLYAAWKQCTHTWISQGITETPTCIETGKEEFSCSICNATKTETVSTDSNNHINEIDVAATASTCTVKGYTAGVYCNDCKKYVGGHEEQPLAAHTLTTQNAKAASCTAEGYTGDQVCAVCKQTITKGTAIAKKSHSLTMVNKAEASCTTAGYTGDQVCTVCKQTITKGSAIAALGHANADSNGNCTRCGQHIKDVTPSQPSNPQPNPNACKYCGKVHTGPFGWLIKFFHSILAIFKR